MGHRLRAGFVIVQHDFRGLFRVGGGIGPALHRGFHKACHFVFKRLIRQAVFEHIKTVFERGDALVFVFKGDQIVGGNARVNHLPILVIGHGGDTGGLFLQQRIDVEPLFQNGHAALGAIGREAQFAHPRQKRIFVAGEIFGSGDAAFLEAGQHHARGFIGLGDVHNRRAVFTRGQGGRHPIDHHIGPAAQQNLHGRHIRATRFDRHVQVFGLIKPFFKSHIIARKLRLRDPFELQRHVIGSKGARTHSGQSGSARQ